MPKKYINLPLLPDDCYNQYVIGYDPYEEAKSISNAQKNGTLFIESSTGHRLKVK